MSRPLDVVGIGNAILDVLANVDDAFLDEHGMVKGSMTLIDAEQAEALYARMGQGVECSGGSAANTIVGLVSLGGRGAYIGKVKSDPPGRAFTGDIRAAGVEFATPQASSGPPTGRCLVLVSPDAQRTLQTFLGASAHLGPDDIDPDAIARARITYLEGYLWDPPQAKRAFLKAARIAHEAGRKVALTLSDSFCVDRHRDSFLDLVSNHVDVLLANEDEIVSLYQSRSFDEAVQRLRRDCEMAALTRGERGSVVVAGGEVDRIDPDPVERPVDTTGAGDLYASGFLFGLTHGYDPVDCGRIGSIAAAEVIRHFGARPQRPLAESVGGRLARIIHEAP